MEQSASIILDTQAIPSSVVLCLSSVYPSRDYCSTALYYLLEISILLLFEMDYSSLGGFIRTCSSVDMTSLLSMHEVDQHYDVRYR